MSCLLFTNVSSGPPASSHDPIAILNQVTKLLDLKDLDQATRLLNSLHGWPNVIKTKAALQSLLL
ncbi:hypothetical protein PCASD_14124 [Puccinia coronata f. sp. avenae]|uniref:MICOS complex subunit MIC60 n=1 Tax=Puccinia coronata f. sp. avenae TaxID=200324 RepID=A0A2N5UFX9_9BASI|nr:hypothetical protein PCASD_14124 [Puccinia coronata f. sp. avenae]